MVYVKRGLEEEGKGGLEGERDVCIYHDLRLLWIPLPFHLACG